MEKSDLEEFIKDYRVINVPAFISYLKEIWKDLASRNEERVKGVDKVIFAYVIFLLIPVLSPSRHSIRKTIFCI
jgi:hypothetical protein